METNCLSQEELKVSLSELKGHLETLEEAGCSVMQIAKQPMNERGQKPFEIFRQGERMRCTTPVLAELERRCQDLMQEVKLLSERQEVLVGMVVNKRDMQKAAPKKCQEKMFEEFKELEEQRAREALELVQKKHMLTKDKR